ncbi:MAG: hypothetical protein Sapg2KO_43750 [Saprospiraceae bacterium]
MIRRVLFFVCFVILSIHSSLAQQSPDTLFTPQLTQAKYDLGQGPVVAIDGGHNNLHRLDGGFAPFARLLSADGYQMRAMNAFSPEAFADIDVLVIVNALHESNIRNWKLPTPSAFTKTEIDLVNKWVEAGGRLLVIADHMPYGGAANDLAQAFGFQYENGFAMGKTQRWPPELYTKEASTLLDNELTKGIPELAGFTGSALIAPKTATTIAIFPKKHRLLLPEVAWQFKNNSTKKPLKQQVFGAVQDYGKGKVAFFTEAAAFTAQIVQKDFKVGFNSPKAPYNQQFVLNVMHWLDQDLKD